MSNAIEKKATITIVDGKFTDTYAIGQIDITHLYFKRIETVSDTGETYRMIEGKEATDEDIKDGTVLHIGQLLGIASGTVYEAVWDWLRGLGEVDGRRFVA